MTARGALEERCFGATTVLFGARGGKYPHGNSLLVRGADASLLNIIRLPSQRIILSGVIKAGDASIT